MMHYLRRTNTVKRGDLIQPKRGAEYAVDMYDSPPSGDGIRFGNYVTSMLAGTIALVLDVRTVGCGRFYKIVDSRGKVGWVNSVWVRSV